jgi:hypothetical protein
MEPASDASFIRTENRCKEFRDRLQDSAREHVMIYESDTQIAWCLSETTLILYMIHLYIKKRSCEVRQAQCGSVLSDTSCLFAQEHPDGGHFAKETIIKCLDMPVVAKNPPFTVPRTVRYLVEKYLDELESVRRELHILHQQPRRNRLAAPEFIVGYELLDIVEEISISDPKVMKIDRPWAHLAEKASVFFVKSLQGQPIAPAGPGPLCRDWMKVPANCNYLVITAPVIHYLLKGQGGCELSEEVLWDFPTPPTVEVAAPLVSSHEVENQSPILHVQPLSLNQRLFSRKQEDPRPFLEYSMNAAFIFGEVSRGCTASISEEGLAGLATVCCHQ